MGPHRAKAQATREEQIEGLTKTWVKTLARLHDDKNHPLYPPAPLDPLAPLYV